MKKWLIFLLIAAMLLAGCSNEQTPAETTAPPDSTASTGAPVDVEFSQTDEEMFSNRDQEGTFEESGSIIIRFDGDAVSCDSGGVSISGTTVTLTHEATYILTGTLNNGSVVVKAADTDKIQLVLNNANIHSETSAPLLVLTGDKVFVTLAEGTDNSLTSGGSFTAVEGVNVDAPLFSKQDLTLNGSGSLTVRSPGGHGIVCKDDLVITGGTYTIECAGRGLDANDSVRIKDGSLTIDAGKDGIHAENADDAALGYVYISGGALNLEAEGDGISAESYLQAAGGTFTITAGGGSANGKVHSSEGFGQMGGGPGGPGRPGGRSAVATTSEDSTSMKGLKAANMLFSGGSFTINSADDGIHANDSIVINGGDFTIATGDDGIHADETLTITAGTVRITECYEGLEATDIVLSGGDVDVVAEDDGLNAAGGTDSSGSGGRDGMFGGPGGPGGASNGSILISGGRLNINASGDGIDANGTVTISGGQTTVVGPTRGDTATLDYDVSGVITGGTFIGTGAAGMAQTFSDSQQGVIALQVGAQAAGTTITVADKDGTVLISHSPELDFQVVILSSPALAKGETYTVTVGSQSGDFTAN